MPTHPHRKPRKTSLLKRNGAFRMTCPSVLHGTQMKIGNPQILDSKSVSRCLGIPKKKMDFDDFWILWIIPDILINPKIPSDWIQISLHEIPASQESSIPWKVPIKIQKKSQWNPYKIKKNPIKTNEIPIKSHQILSKPMKSLQNQKNLSKPMKSL